MLLSVSAPASADAEMDEVGMPPAIRNDAVQHYQNNASCTVHKIERYMLLE